MQRDRRIETRFGLRGDENEDSWEIQAKKAPQEAVEKRKNADAVAAENEDSWEIQAKKAPQEAVEKRKNADAVAAAAPAAVGHMVAVLSL